MYAYIGGRIFLDHPVLGTGWHGQLPAEEYVRYLPDARERFPDLPARYFPDETGLIPQQTYDQVLYSLGIVGALLFLALGVITVRSTIQVARAWPRGDPDEPAAYVPLGWAAALLRADRRRPLRRQRADGDLLGGDRTAAAAPSLVRRGGGRSDNVAAVSRTVLVTGGAGFIGTTSCAPCSSAATPFACSTTSRPGTAGISRGSGTTPTSSRASCGATSASTTRCAGRLVFHQGALPSVPRSVQDPLTTSAVTIEGTLNVLLAARDEDVRRVVFASSSSVYGNTGTLPRTETLQPDPISPYAVAKLAAERYCVSFEPLYGLETVALRYFNVFGPRQDPNSQYAAVVPRFIAAVDHGGPVTIYGDGTQSRDFTYVENVVQANLLAGDREGVEGRVLNVATGRQATVNELADAVGDVLGKPVRRSTCRSAPVTSAIPGPTSAPPRACSATRRPSGSRTGSASPPRRSSSANAAAGRRRTRVSSAARVEQSGLPALARDRVSSRSRNQSSMSMRGCRLRSRTPASDTGPGGRA